MVEVFGEPDLATAHLQKLGLAYQDATKSISQFMNRLRLLVIKAFPELVFKEREKILVSRFMRIRRTGTSRTRWLLLLSARQQRRRREHPKESRPVEERKAWPRARLTSCRRNKETNSWIHKRSRMKLLELSRATSASASRCSSSTKQCAQVPRRLVAVELSRVACRGDTAVAFEGDNPAGASATTAGSRATSDRTACDPRRRFGG